ncbi:unnamed protein product [Sphagnum balticum]
MSIIKSTTQWILWRDAQSRPEHGATRFWEHKLQIWFPASEGWVVSSQQPPTGENSDRRRVESLIEILHPATNSMQKLLIYEAKRSQVGVAKVDELEMQAYSACQLALQQDNRSSMYALTTIGTSARIWIADSSPYLNAFIPPSDAISDANSYIEANSTDGHYIEEAIAYMKLHNLFPVAKTQVLRSLGTPEPPDVTSIDQSGEGSYPVARGSIDNPSSINARVSSTEHRAGGGGMTALPNEPWPDDTMMLSELWIEEGETARRDVFYFRDESHSDVEAPRTSWRLMSKQSFDGSTYDAFVFTSSSGKHYAIWSLDGWPHVGERAREEGKGKGKASSMRK